MTYTPAGTVEPWRGLAVAISADRMLVTSEGAALLLGVVGVTERLGRRDGIGLSPQLAAVRDVLRVIAAAEPSHRDVQAGPDLAPSEDDQRIGLGEASKLLGRSRRQTSRLAAAGSFGPTQRLGQARLVSRSEVVAYIVQREATTP